VNDQIASRDFHPEPNRARYEGVRARRQAEYRPEPATNIGFVVVALGGVGAAAGRQVFELHEADGRRLPCVFAQIDTEQSLALPGFQQISLQMDERQIARVRDNPSRFGETAARIVRDHAAILQNGSIRFGGRTMRALTQLGFLFRRSEVARGLQRSIDELRDQAAVNSVQFVLLSSSAGGTGSACQPLLIQHLGTESFRHELLRGMSTTLLTPVVSFAVDPFAFLRTVDHTHALQIGANIYAFRREMTYLADTCSMLGLSFVIGFDNQYGVVLRDGDAMAGVLGRAVYETMLHWPELNAKWADTWHRKIVQVKYRSDDQPETVFPGLATRCRREEDQQ
jgi:hypothetical protein